MKTLLLSLIPGIFLGWLVAEALNSRTPEIEESGRSTSPISLLGNHPTSPTPPPIREVANSESLNDLLENLDSASFEEIKGIIRTWDNSYPTHQMKRLIIRQLVAMDPEAAFEFLTSNEIGRMYPDEALEAWVDLDPMGAFEGGLKKYPTGKFLYAVVEPMDSESRAQAYRALRDRGFHKEHPDAFMGVAETLVRDMDLAKGEEIYQDLVDAGFDGSHPEQSLKILTHFAEGNPEVTAKRVFEIASRDIDYIREDVFRKVLAEWFKQDADAAFKWGAEKLDPDGTGNWGIDAKNVANVPSNFAHFFIETLIAQGGIQELERIWPLLSNNLRRQSFSFPEDQLDEAVEWIDSNAESPTQHSRMLLNLMNDYSEAGRPEMMPELLARVGSDYSGDRDITLISAKWAEKDIDGLQEWILSSEDSEIRKHALKGMSMWAQDNDFSYMYEFMIQHPELFPHFDPEIARYDYVHTMNRGEVKSLFKHIPYKFRIIKVNQYAHQHVESSPAEVLSLLDTLPETEPYNNIYQRAIAYLARVDGLQAAEWVDALDEGPQKVLATKNLTNTWARTDPIAAQEWLANQPPSDHRDQASQQVATIINRRHPEQALSLAQSISDPKLQEEVLSHTIQNMARNNSDQASEHLEAAGLSSQWNSLVREERELGEVFDEE